MTRIRNFEINDDGLLPLIWMASAMAHHEHERAQEPELMPDAGQAVHDDAPLRIADIIRLPEFAGAISEGMIRGAIAGLLGAGRSRLARMLFGLEPIASGTITLRGQKVAIGSASQAADLGLALVPEDRRRQGLVLAHSIQDNIELPILQRLGATPFVDRIKSRTTTDELISCDEVFPGRSAVDQIEDR